MTENYQNYDRHSTTDLGSSDNFKQNNYQYMHTHICTHTHTHTHTHTPSLSYSNDKRQKTKDKEEILKEAREEKKTKTTFSLQEQGQELQYTSHKLS